MTTDISSEGGKGWLCPGEGGRVGEEGKGRGVPHHVAYLMMHVMLPTPLPPVDRMIERCL